MDKKNEGRLWYKKIGYESNPLTIKPTDSSGLTGYEKIINRIEYQLKIGNVIFLEGSYGSGKSSILKYLRRRVPGNVVYFNCSQNRGLKKAVMESKKFWRKLLFMKPKQMVLLIDEANHTDHKEFDFLYEFYIMDRIKSIVFAGTDFKDVPFNKAFKADTKLYKLDEIKLNLAVQIIESRMPGQSLFTQPVAKAIFSASRKNPRNYLANLEDIARIAVTKGRKKVSKKDVDIFFGKK